MIATYHLLGYHDDRLDGELSVAVVEQVLQTGAEQVDDQDVVQSFLAEVINIRDPGCDMSVEFIKGMQLYTRVRRCGD